MFVGNVHFFFQQLEFVQGRRRALGSSALASAARVFFFGLRAVDGSDGRL